MMPPDGVGLPVLAFGGLLLFRRQVLPPAQFLEQHVIELGIPGDQVGALRMRAVGRQQIDAVALDAEVGAKLPPPSITCRLVSYRLAVPGCLRLDCPAWPRQAEVVAGQVVAGLGVLAALGAQRLDVEHVHVAHVSLQALGALGPCSRWSRPRH